MWWWIALACGIAFATKAIGYLVDAEKLQNERFLHVASCMTIGLLASLVVTNTFVSGQELMFDARVVALVAAGVALALKAPFIVVVIVGAAGAAVARLLGMA